MKKNSLLVLFVFVFISIHAQKSIQGKLIDESNQVIAYANVVLYNAKDSMLIKVETADIEGSFKFVNIRSGDFYLVSTYLGYEDFTKVFTIEDKDLDLGECTMNTSSVILETAVVKARRAIVEVKADRTVFNVESTINSVGSNGLDLLRKAPGVLVDNNLNISVLGRSGVLIYVDGKRLPLAGDELTNYLRNLTAAQIDKIDIINNPGAKYEAEGNAGIIDIRLKKNKNHGANGSLSFNISNGYVTRWNTSASANYRNQKFNLFGTANISDDRRQEILLFQNSVNGFYTDEENIIKNFSDNISSRLGVDYFITKNTTIGVLFNAGTRDRGFESSDIIEISPLQFQNNIDSILIAENTGKAKEDYYTANANLLFDNGTSSLSIDFDYGIYENTNHADQPNIYVDNTRMDTLSSTFVNYDTPTTIEIQTAKLDYEFNLFGGKTGIGLKVTDIATDNTFAFYNGIVGENSTIDNSKSNDFFYTENVIAGYVSYNRQLNSKISLSSGLRVENTKADGVLNAYDPDFQEPPVDLDYVNFFPNLGLVYQWKPTHSFNANYSRRINRPDYNVLNPFVNQISELSFFKGNANILAERVHNIELGYTYAYRYSFKLAYSKTLDQITRIIGPDNSDPRATFINWDNLAEQTVINFSVSAPFTFSSFWNAYFNITTSYVDNQADYGGGATVDLQRFSYNIYQQQSLQLPMGYIFEVSGWFSGPGIWGGVFKYDTSYSLDFGLQKRFLNDQLNIKISAQDVFRQAGWSGFSEFNGLYTTGSGDWDSRRVSLSLSYNFGNQKVNSRNRKTGAEEESGRIGG